VSARAFRAHILHCLKDPGDTATGDAFEYFADGLLLVEKGCVAAIGPAPELLTRLGEDVEVIDYTDRLILPGFVDTHIHYVQTDVIAAHGKQLLDWLETYTFPAERRFADAAHAQEVAQFFVRELLRNGTTMALVLGSVHATSVDAIFQAAADTGMRLIAGKVMMDRNCPDYLRDTPESGYTESRDLIERWHKRERLSYAITPRFAPTSSDAQLQRAGELASEFEDVYVHTHLAENRDEVAWVQKLFPKSRSYLDVYDQYGLLRERALYAHSIHLDDTDRERFVATGAAVSFCPTCNLFIGSGLFDLREAWRCGMRVGLGTDVGGGTTFNLLQVLNEAYKVAQLQSFNLSPLRALYLATLAGAEALYLDDKIGNLQAGREADFVVLDREATPLLARRTAVARDIDEVLFALIMLGDDRCIEATYLRGERAHQRA
jgi:guanine deaminase